MDMPDYAPLDDREFAGLRDKVASMTKSFATTGALDAGAAMLASQKLRNLKGGLDPKRKKRAEAASSVLENLGLGQPPDQETLSALLKTLDGLTSDAPQRV